MAIFIVKVKLFQMVFFIKLLLPKNETKSVKKIDPDCTLGSILCTMFEYFCFLKSDMMKYTICNYLTFNMCSILMAIEWWMEKSTTSKKL